MLPVSLPADLLPDGHTFTLAPPGGGGAGVTELYQLVFTPSVPHNRWDSPFFRAGFSCLSLAQRADSVSLPTRTASYASVTLPEAACHSHWWIFRNTPPFPPHSQFITNNPDPPAASPNLRPPNPDVRSGTSSEPRSK